MSCFQWAVGEPSGEPNCAVFLLPRRRPTDGWEFTNADDDDDPGWRVTFFNSWWLHCVTATTVGCRCHPLGAFDRSSSLFRGDVLTTPIVEDVFRCMEDVLSLRCV